MSINFIEKLSEIYRYANILNILKCINSINSINSDDQKNFIKRRKIMNNFLILYN